MTSYTGPALIIYRGLPGSGKTTHALDLLTRSPRHTRTHTRVNRDQLRIMTTGQRWTGNPTHEETVTHLHTLALNALLAVDKVVLVDDTNLNPAVVDNLKTIASRWTHKIHTLDHFMQVSIIDCLNHDAQRPHPVGPQVIADLRARWADQFDQPLTDHEQTYLDLHLRVQALERLRDTPPAGSPPATPLTTSDTPPTRVPCSYHGCTNTADTDASCPCPRCTYLPTEDITLTPRPHRTPDTHRKQ